MRSYSYLATSSLSLGCFMQAEESITSTASGGVISLLVSQLRLMVSPNSQSRNLRQLWLSEVSSNLQTRVLWQSRRRKVSNLPICHNYGRRKSHLASVLTCDSHDVASHFQSRYLLQLWLPEVSPGLRPRPPMAKLMRLRVFGGATWIFQQGIRIHKHPFSCLSSSPRLLVNSLVD